ncbi:hypothetical protein ULMS_11260 [Patiriisocius marinistellae]|uniref:Uncharacterized protein n=1 Tax=Patiriisocius marinistellae TaxID=2494560 RepID=A0A5J4FWH5_9FLAO|nr:hypothetical protein [Patiriisocius marinistellae]GEQ85618.1 hypothetical protein ULMS_11260 [Patiriisocius marinistellae]
MKRLILIVCLFFYVATPSFAQQSINDYSFVIVPEKFDFLAEEDQFQLNSLTKFLFNKNGFNALYRNELPEVDFCDGLTAEITEESNFTRTKIFITLKDCRGNEIYKGEPGASKFKEYRKAYHDALRNAFEFINKLHVQQNDIVVKERAIDEIDSKKEAVVSSATLSKPIVPSNTFNQYSLSDVAYLLKKTAEGFTLFQESELAENGLLVIGDITKKGNSYSCKIADKEYPVSFKSNKDLVIYKEDSNMVLKFQN